MTYDLARDIVDRAPDAQIALQPYSGASDDLAYLRQYVLDGAAAFYDVDPSLFDTSTVLSTTLLRDYVHRALMHVDSRPAFQSIEDPVAPPVGDVAFLFRYPAAGQCGETALQMHHVYRAFGYDSAWADSLNGTLAGGPEPYTDSHVITNVWTEDAGWIAQDSYLNQAMRNAAGEMLSYHEVRQAEAAQPGSVIFDNFTGYLRFREERVPREDLHPDDAAGATGGLFGTPFSWLVDAGRVVSGGVSQMFPGTGPVHDSGTDLGGTFDSTAQALASLSALHAAGLSWQGAVISLRDTVFAAGFKMVDEQTGQTIGEWITIRLSDGSFATIEYQQGRVVLGSFDQIALEAMGAGTARNSGTDLSEFLNPIVLIGADGLVQADWAGQQALQSNSAPVLVADPARVALETLYHVDDFFQTRDADGDLPTFFILIDQDGMGIGADFVRLDGLGAGTGIVVSRAELDQWRVDTGASPGVSSLMIQASDGIAWGAPEELAFATYRTQTDTEDAIWDTSTTYWTATGALDSTVVTYDGGGFWQIEYDVRDRAIWDSLQTRYSANGELVARQVDYDSGGSVRTDYDTSGAEVWINWQYYYNSQDQLEFERLTYSDGGSLHTSHDFASSEVWTMQEQRRDAQGRLEAELTVFDTGATRRTDYDTDDLYDWSSIVTDYDADGVFIAEAIVFDA